MKLVLDASVAAAAARPSEPFFAISNARVMDILTPGARAGASVLVPVEVAAALARRGHDNGATRRYVDAFTWPPHEIVTLGPKRARLVMDIAMRCKLRAADAVYVWLASRRGLPLCTLDAEIATRAGPLCTVITP
jgi:predicted nucleic acid-binding protein